MKQRANEENPTPRQIMIRLNALAIDFSLKSKYQKLEGNEYQAEADHASALLLLETVQTIQTLMETSTQLRTEVNVEKTMRQQAENEARRRQS